MFNNKCIFVTGGTGSFGKAFVLDILKKYKPKKVIIFSRDELKQFELSNHELCKKNKNKLRFFLGDIRDKERLRLSFRNNKIDYVVHAAALKHVNISEYNPFEFIKTNVIGSQNLIDVCLEFNIKKVIALSTDKAASPINLYGATKLCSDKLFISANLYAGQHTFFSVVRYGNVMGSRGSVIPLFLSQKNKKYFSITNKEMTRFNITLQEAIDFVKFAFTKMRGSEIFVPKLPSYNILDLAKSISKNKKIKFIGIRNGEKIHEEMITKSDSLNTLEYKDYFIIYPKIKSKVSSSKKTFPKLCKNNFFYDSQSNKNFLSVLQLQKLIKNLK